MRRLIGPLLATSLLAGGCCETPPGPEWHEGQKTVINTEFAAPGRTREDSVMSEHDKSIVRSAYASLQKALGSAMTARLVFVEGNSTFVCSETSELRLVLTSLSSPRYCTASRVGEIVVTGVWTAYVSPGFAGYNSKVEDAGLVFTVLHEEGHEQQLREGVSLQEKDRELDADCRAGQYFRAMHDTTVDFQSMERYVGGMLTTDFARHGFPEERQAYLRNGYLGNSCP